MTVKKSRQQELDEKARDWHDHNVTELADLNRTLLATIQTVEETDIPYALIGGVAVKELGRPRVTHDIDIFVQPDDADRVLEVLERKGFHTERRDPFWLYKAWKDEVLVDVVFKSSGDIYFDEELRAHVRRIPYLGSHINAIGPEDFIVIKSAAHQEDNPHHWFDALAVLTQGNLDWEYLLKRARHAPRRVLSVLIYAQSIDIAVPNEVIEKLYRLIFEPQTYVPPSVIHPYRKEKSFGFNGEATEETPEKDSLIYTKGRIIEALTDDQRIPEHDLKVIVTDTEVVIRGEVFTHAQKEAVNEVLQRATPELTASNQVSVRVLTPPESEAIQ